MDTTRSLELENIGLRESQLHWKAEAHRVTAERDALRAQLAGAIERSQKAHQALEDSEQENDALVAALQEARRALRVMAAHCTATIDAALRLYPEGEPGVTRAWPAGGFDGHSDPYLPPRGIK